MANNLFVIAAGGTGAKVVESLLHLCAAGLGPGQLDVLLLDVDQANGNVDRTTGTAKLYEKLSQWDWSIAPKQVHGTGLIRQAQMQFFRSKVTMHTCLESISMVREGGLAVHLRMEEGARNLLNVLYTEAEQTSKCEKGFLARPNLGSLVLGGHLSEMFAARTGGAVAFKERLLSVLNGATEAAPVPVVMVGSIFGGTGASMFPVVCQCLKKALVPEADAPIWKKVAPSAVMLAPYFLPNQAPANERAEVETVDPSRFLVDTANTLSHYTSTSGLDSFKSAYFIGSDDPTQNRLRFVDGAREQANPPFIEEVVAALAVLDAGKTISSGNGSRRIFQPPKADALEWDHLPFEGDGAFHLALLLEVAAFILLRAHSGRPLSGGLLEACEAWSAEFELLPWYKRLLDGWAKHSFGDSYHTNHEGSGWSRLNNEKILSGEAAASKARDALAEYSFRLLLWSRTALPSDGPYRLVKLGQEMDYAIVWELMCGVAREEIEPNGSGPGDNALVRLVRAAAVGLAKIVTGQVPKKGVVLSPEGALKGFPSNREGNPQPMSLPIARDGMDDLAKNNNVARDIHNEFTKTLI
jgi:hypothetical protein